MAAVADTIGDGMNQRLRTCRNFKNGEEYHAT
jgi:hypothetical protein